MDIHLPALAPQHVGGEQPADRPADDDGARHARVSPRAGFSPAAGTCCQRPGAAGNAETAAACSAASTAATCSGVSRSPSLLRRQTTSSAVRRPFRAGEVAQLGLGQVGAEDLAEIGRAGRTGQQHQRPGAIGPHQPPGMRFGEEGVPRPGLGDQRLVAIHREIAAGQRVPPGPAGGQPARRRQVRRQSPQRILGEAAGGGDLAAEDREQRRARLGLELQHVVPRRLLRRRGAVVVQRPHAGIGPDHHRRGSPAGGNTRWPRRRDRRPRRPRCAPRPGRHGNPGRWCRSG